MKNHPPSVLFNASVILSGIYSPSGGSAKLLKWSKEKRITGLISEIILDEVLRWSEKIGKTQEETRRYIHASFPHILTAPSKNLVLKFAKIVVDLGDAHVLTSAYDAKVKFLVTLDQKHLLAIKDKISWAKIVSPKEMIEWLR